MDTENLVFKPLHVSHASNEDATILFWSTYDFALPVRSHIGTTADAILANLITDTKACRAQVARQRKSVLSDDVKALRKTCRELFAEIKRTISFSAQSRLVNLHTPGEELKSFFKPNWHIPKEALPTQIQMTVNLMKKYYAEPELVTAAQAIGVDALMSDLETTNATLKTIYLERIEEVGGRPASGTDLRPAANESYMQFCTAIEQAVRYTPNEELIGLFQLMNVQRKVTHRLMAGRESRKKES